jgi:peptidyl-prolyl cis-trans isomerase C
MSKTVFAICIAIGVAMFSGLLISGSVSAQESGEVAADTTVATVNGEPIEARAVRRAMVRTGPSAAARLQTVEQKALVVEELVRIQVLAQLARDNGYAEDPEIREAVQMLLAERYWRDLTAQLDRPDPSEGQVQAFFEANPELFTEPLRLRGSVLSLRLPGHGNDSAKDGNGETIARAQALLHQAQAADSAGFADLARRFSNDPTTRARGGDMGFVVEGASVFRTEAAVIDALFKLAQPGDVSPLVITDRAVYIVRLQERQGGSALPLSVVVGDIRQRLILQQRDEDLAATYADLRSGFEVEIDRELLEHIGPQDSEASGPPSFPLGEASR